jgi:hypothetical protein
MLELLLSAFIVSRCGDSDFKTREFYTHHVKQHYNYYHPAIILNLNDTEIRYRLYDFQDEYWDKVAKQFKEKQENSIRYVPWLSYKDNSLVQEFVYSEKNKFKNVMEDYLCYRYATILYCESLIKNKGYQGWMEVGEKLQEFYDEEVSWAEEHKFEIYRNRPRGWFLEKSMKESVEPLDFGM